MEGPHHSRLLSEITEVGLVSKEVGVRLDGLEVALPQVEEPGEEALTCEIKNWKKARS